MSTQYIRTAKDQHHPKSRAPTQDSPKYQGKKSCGNYGRLHLPRQCPAYGKTCLSCGKGGGHYAKLCRSTNKSRSNPNQQSKIRQLEVDGNTSDHAIDEVNSDLNSSINEHARPPFKDKAVRLRCRSRVGLRKPCNAKLTAFGGHSISVLGKGYLRCAHRAWTEVVEF